MSLVVVIATGGTIASTPSAAGGLRAKLPATALLGLVSMPSGVSVEVVDALAANSFALTNGDLRAIEGAVQQHLLRPDVTGVVVTHGTDTLEETAALLALVHDDDRPVVLTGAMRPPGHPQPDGPANLRDAVRTAADPSRRGKGVLVSLGGQTWPAIGVTKCHTHDLAGFANVRKPAEVPRSAPLPRPGSDFDTVQVPVINSHVGADGYLVEAAIEHGANGIVLVGTGSGNVTPPLMSSVRRALAAGVPVAVSTRVWRGPLEAVYAGGGGHDLAEAGAVLISGMPPPQVRILTCLVVSAASACERGGLLRAAADSWGAPTR